MGYVGRTRPSHCWNVVGLCSSLSKHSALLDGSTVEYMSLYVPSSGNGEQAHLLTVTVLNPVF